MLILLLYSLLLLLVNGESLLNNKLKDIIENNNGIINNLHTINQRFETINNDLIFMDKKLNNYKSDLENFKRILDKGAGSIAFVAELFDKASGPNGENTIVPFNLGHLNIGNAYNTTEYTFTAPENGVYLFSWNNLGSYTQDGLPACSYMAKNGQALPGFGIGGTLSDANANPWSYQNAILRLNQNDRIDIRLGNSPYCVAIFNPVFDHTRGNTFIGVLLHNTGL